MSRTYSQLLAAAAAAVFAVGCAQSGGDISYVQPNYVKKADLLEGVWYFRNTVTDTPPTTGFTFTGETGELEKIVFDVQEGHLVGFRAYPQIPGTDGNIEDASRPSGTTTRYCKAGVCTGGHKYYGNPVVAYPIEKHFDIQRGYNSTTGEQTNVINENSSDRPWNEREYIRVNWTAEIMNVKMGTWGLINTGGAHSNIASWIHPNQPGTDPYDWPRQEFEDVNGEAKLNYFEFTGRYVAKPDSFYVPEWGGSIPFCWLSQRYDCTAQEIYVRTSIAKIDPNKTLDYEPLIYDNAMMAKFGYFRTERINYDRRFGNLESDVIYLANRHRIWESSFQRDAAGNVDWSKPIPFAQRTPKPIVYYVPPANRMGGDEAYRAYMEEARILEAGWDKAFRRAVAAAQTGSDANWQSVPQMLIVCDNPVPAGAPAACGPAGFEARFGDLRRNFLWTIPEAVPNGLLGYGPSSADPETGEIISANANTYSAAVALQAQHTLDVVKVIYDGLFPGSGTSIDELIRGSDVRDYVMSRPSYASALSRTNRVQSELQGTAVQRTAEESKGAFEKPTLKYSSAIATLRATGLPISNGDRFQAMADTLAQHPQLESVFLDNPEVVEAAKTILPPHLADPTMTSSEDSRAALRGILVNPDKIVSLQNARIEYASRRNIYLVDFFQDNQLLAVAFREGKARFDKITALEAAGVSPVEARLQVDDELRWKFRKHIWRATSEHEIGHTFGLRHNFQGSFDAVNYFDAYWELKQQTLTVDQQDGTGNVRRVIPRTPTDLKNASDGTADQLFGGMYDYEYSSIMDYGGKANADWQGVGKYDEAAILFAYSGGVEPGYVEVFDAPLRQGEQSFFGSDGQVLTVTGAGYDLPVVNALKANTAVPNYTERFHYTTVPLRFGSGPTVDDVIADGIQNLRIRSIARWKDVKNKYDELRAILATNPEPTTQQVASANVPLEVPYMFCTDDHVGYLISCHRWDRGPDYYEINKTWMESYWNNYFFNHFRRDRYEFGAANAYYGALMTFRNSSMMYRHWVWANYGAKGPNSQKVPNYTSGKFGYDAQLQDTWSMASLDSVNNLLQVLSVPSAGFYMLYRPTENGQAAFRWDLLVDPFEFDELSPAGQKQYMDYYGPIYNAQGFGLVRRGDGRPMYSRYDNKGGFGFYRRIEEIGHTIDQMGAIVSTLYSGTPFMGADITADTNRFYLPFSLVFRDEMYQTFGAVWAEDSCYSCTAGGETKFRPQMYLRSKPTPTDPNATEPVIAWPVHVYGGDYIQDFDYPKREDVSNQPAVAPVNLTTTWTAQIYSLAYGMIGFAVNNDLDFAKQAQIIQAGSGEDIAVPAGYEKVEVEDFTSGIRYAAFKRIGAEDTTAVRKVKMANEARIEALDPGNSEEDRAQWTESFRARVRDLELMRGFHSIFGRVW